MNYFLSDLDFSEFARKKNSKDKVKRRRKKSKSSSDGNDELTNYDKVNLPLKAWSNTHQSSREIRGWINTLRQIKNLAN